MIEQLKEKVDDHEERLGEHKEMLADLLKRQQEHADWHERKEQIIRAIQERHEEFEERLKDTESLAEKVEATQTFILDQMKQMPNNNDINDLKTIASEARIAATDSVPKAVTLTWTMLLGVISIGTLVIALLEFISKFH